MSYGPNFPDLFRRAAEYVDKILRGTKAGELPVEQPTKFDLVFDLKTAKALGFTIPPILLARAAELIETAPDANISTTSTATRALMNATAAIPIVAAITGDPIGLGFTEDLSHPTGNVTGFSTFNYTLAAKRLEMLREIVPAMQHGSADVGAGKPAAGPARNPDQGGSLISADPTSEIAGLIPTQI